VLTDVKANTQNRIMTLFLIDCLVFIPMKDCITVAASRLRSDRGVERTIPGSSAIF
jgi:hypothetical protein